MADDDVLTQLEALRSEVIALRGELDALRSRPHAQGVAEVPVEPTTTTTRRQMLAIVGGAAAAGVAIAAGASLPAAAANGDGVTIANNTVSSAGNVVSTFLNYSPTTTNTNNRHLFVVGDASAAFNPAAADTAAVAGYSAGRVASGVYGRSEAGVGVHAVSGSGVALRAGGTGRVLLDAANPVGPPASGTFSAGEIVRDGQNDLWICITGGSSARWRKLGGGTSAGALHVIEPTRVFDSRFSTAIASGQSRTVSVADGINVDTGATAGANVVPSGATAIQFTLTITGAQQQGFLAVTPGDASTFKASSINWTPGLNSIATGALVKLDGNRSVKVFAGGGGSTHFIVDVTGYYL